jgi:hypothetical protein
MVRILDRGVRLVFIPLLSLSAEAMSKFQSAVQHNGSARTFRLDEIYNNERDLYKLVLQRRDELPPSTPSTVFAFLSPQHLCHSERALNTFISCGGVGNTVHCFWALFH